MVVNGTSRIMIQVWTIIGGMTNWSTGRRRWLCVAEGLGRFFFGFASIFVGAATIALANTDWGNG